MSAELITLVLGFLTLAGGQIATALVLVGRMDRQTDQAPVTVALPDFRVLAAPVTESAESAGGTT